MGTKLFKDLKEFYAKGNEGYLSLPYNGEQSLREYVLKKEAYEIFAVAAPHQLDKKSSFAGLVYLCATQNVDPVYLKEYYKVYDSGNVDRINFSPEDPFGDVPGVFDDTKPTLVSWLDSLEDSEQLLHVRYLINAGRNINARKSVTRPQIYWLGADASDDEVSDLVFEAMKSKARHKELEAFALKAKGRPLSGITFGFFNTPLTQAIEELPEQDSPFRQEVLGLIEPLENQAKQDKEELKLSDEEEQEELVNDDDAQPSWYSQYLTKNTVSMGTCMLGLACYAFYQHYIAEAKTDSQK